MSVAVNLSPTRFRVVLATILAAVFVLLQVVAMLAPPAPASRAWQQDGRLHVFFHPDCPHCHEAIEYLGTQATIAFVLHDVTERANRALLRDVAEQHAIADDELGVPLFVFGTRYLIGFHSAERTGPALADLARPAAGEPDAQTGPSAAPGLVLPIVGAVDPAGYSLLALTVLMGFSDGFNPCAMWVLVYLISLIAGIQDRQKIWWLVGTFVLASGVLYFLFMTAWLNTFLLVGYIRPLTQLVGLVAIGFGVQHLYEIAVNRGLIVCEIGDLEARGRTMRRIRSAVAAPIGFGSLLLIVGLAFTVNAIEFVCSAALPAIYTHILALSDLAVAQYYAYIALYVAVFMLDDLVIFALAAFAVQSVIDTRYAAVSRALGGVILVALGLWMLAR